MGQVTDLDISGIHVKQAYVTWKHELPRWAKTKRWLAQHEEQLLQLEVTPARQQRLLKQHM